MGNGMPPVDREGFDDQALVLDMADPGLAPLLYVNFVEMKRIGTGTNLWGNFDLLYAVKRPFVHAEFAIVVVGILNSFSSSRLDLATVLNGNLGVVIYKALEVARGADGRYDGAKIVEYLADAADKLRGGASSDSSDAVGENVLTAADLQWLTAIDLDRADLPGLFEEVRRVALSEAHDTALDCGDAVTVVTKDYPVFLGTGYAIALGVNGNAQAKSVLRRIIKISDGDHSIVLNALRQIAESAKAGRDFDLDSLIR